MHHIPVPWTSIVEGSALRPHAFTVVASDLTTKYPSSAFDKFTDDTYLIILATIVHSTDEELSNIENWTKLNN